MNNEKYVKRCMKSEDEKKQNEMWRAHNRKKNQKENEMRTIARNDVSILLSLFRCFSALVALI